MLVAPHGFVHVADEDPDLVRRSARDRGDRQGHAARLAKQRQARGEPGELVRDADPVVEPLDGQVEVAALEAVPKRGHERGQVGHSLARVAVHDAEPTPVIAVVGGNRLEDVVLDMAGPCERRERLDDRDGIVEGRDGIDQVEEDPDPRRRPPRRRSTGTPPR